jgi:hypothetical protein
VHIVTKKHLDAFADGAAATFTTLKTVSEGAAKSGLAKIAATFSVRRRAIHPIEI